MPEGVSKKCPESAPGVSQRGRRARETLVGHWGGGGLNGMIPAVSAHVAGWVAGDAPMGHVL